MKNAIGTMGRDEVAVNGGRKDNEVFVYKGLLELIPVAEFGKFGEELIDGASLCLFFAHTFRGHKGAAPKVDAKILAQHAVGMG